LDGTLAYYDGWKGEDHIGEPIPLMVSRVKRWLSEGRWVKIFTARMHDGKESTRRRIEDWCEEHLGVRLEVTNVKDFSMVELWDDRCVQVDPNTGICLGMIAQLYDERFTFSVALHWLMNGRRLQREGWNGKGMWIELQRPDKHSKMTLPYLFMKTAEADLVPWLASQTDLLAADWRLLPDGEAA
jgi:hypothetical protein